MALTKCKECGQTVSTEAYTCPHCGAPQRNAPLHIPPPIVVQTQAPQKKKKMGIFSGCLVIVLAIFIIGLISAFIIPNITPSGSQSSAPPAKAQSSGGVSVPSSSPSPSPAPRVQEAAPHSSSAPPHSLEHELAIIDDHGPVADDDVKVARFRSLLTQLADSFSESPQKIADTSVKAQQILKENGIDERVMNLMEGMNQLFPGKAGNQQYSQMLAFYITLRNKGRSHEEAISDLKDMISTFSGADVTAP